MAVPGLVPLGAGQLPLALPPAIFPLSASRLASQTLGSTFAVTSHTVQSTLSTVTTSASPAVNAATLLPSVSVPSTKSLPATDQVFDWVSLGSPTVKQSCPSGALSTLRRYFSWLDRLLCTVDGFCAVKHEAKHSSALSRQNRPTAQGQDLRQEIKLASDYWTSGDHDPELWTQEEREIRKVPQYVLDYAPYVHLFSGEEFWPCDLAEHLVHTTPHLNYTPIARMKNDRTLDNLDELNQYGWQTYLQSDDDVEQRPNWLGGKQNIPELRSADEPGGHSSAPAILIVVPKEHGIVDAFWFYFYSYNLGNKVFNVRFGNHVGDWEHSLVRFKDGEPDSVFLSEHNFGEAYGYDALEKIGKRPVIYSATGSHAMYAVPGLHPYVLPWGLLHDETDRGPLWDPSMNVHAYTYNLSTDTLMASTQTPKAPTSWFDYRGHWGDKAYPMSDKRQYQFAGQYHYVSGPIGARFKSLARQKVCPGHGECKIKHWLGGPRLKVWEGGDTREEMEGEDLERG